MSEPDEFEYDVHLKAREAFINALRNEGVLLPQVETEYLTFSSEKSIDMKGYKKKGMIWSYTIARLHKTKEIIERG